MLGAFPPLHPLDLSVDTLLSHEILERSHVTDEGDRFELIGVAKQLLAVAQLHEAARKIQVHCSPRQRLLSPDVQPYRHAVF